MERYYRRAPARDVVKIKGVEWMKEQLLHIRLPKCLVVLTKGELLTLLRQDPDLWQKALQRGKAARRARQTEKRRKSYMGKPQIK